MWDTGQLLASTWPELQRLDRGDTENRAGRLMCSTLGTHGSLWSVDMVSRHDACLNVGIKDGQGLQSAGYRDNGGSEAHDHSMSRVMSRMVNNMEPKLYFVLLSIILT